MNAASLASMRFITAIRAKLGLSIPDLADALGMQSVYLYRYERGKDKVKPPVQIRLDVLCKLRKVGKLNWAQLGKMLDDEFLQERKEK